MTPPQARAVAADTVDLPEAGPYPIPSGGTGPDTRWLVLEEGAEHEFGIWECSPGTWWEDTGSVAEVFHVLSGTGRITSDAGEAVDLRPGVTVHVPPGWAGTWRVDTTLRKIHALHAPAPTPPPG